MSGITLAVFTAFHVALSLLAIGAGGIAVLGFLMKKTFKRWNTLFLLATGITSLTGFLFPFHGMTPGIAIGVVCLVVLALAAFARGSKMPKTYIASVCFAEALNLIVLVTQLFEKVPILHHLAPTGKEPLVAVTQLMSLLFLTVLSWIGVRPRSVFLIGTC